MIAYVSGRVAALAPDAAVLDVGGVGLSLQCTPPTLARLRRGEPATLPAALVVREDSLTLYGFADEDERTAFELLQTATGVGPRLAQSVLAVLSPAELRRAVAGEDVAALTRVPGIGRKGAQRIVLELAGRLTGLADDAAAAPAGLAAPAWRDQVHDALVGLGWSGREADGALDAVATQLSSPGPTTEQAVDVAAALRAALQVLGRP